MRKDGGVTKIVLALVLLSAVSPCMQNKKTGAVSEQLDFSAEEEEVRNPVMVPEEALVLLRKDEIVHNALEDQKLSADKLPKSWFTASRVHLAGASEIDLIVIGQRPLAGANVKPFWVFRPAAHGFELILQAGGHDLHISNKRWKGYRNIQASAVVTMRVSSVFYRFNGKQYKVYKKRIQEIR